MNDFCGGEMSTEVEVSCERGSMLHVHGATSRPVLTFFYYFFFLSFFFELKIAYNAFFFVIKFNIKTFGKNYELIIRLFNIIVHYMNEPFIKTMRYLKQMVFSS